MNYDSMLSKMYQEIFNSLDMKDLDDKLKNGYGYAYQDVKNQIIMEAQRVVPKYLKELNSEQINILQRYISSSKIENNKNIMRATYEEDGFVYTIAFSENVVHDFILNYNQPAQENDSRQM